MISLDKHYNRRISSDRFLEKPSLPRISPDSKISIKRNLSSRYSHVANNRKKKYIQEVRFTEIERENRMLLEKIHNIIKKPSDISHRKQYHSHIGRHISKRNFVNRQKGRSRQSGNDSDGSWETKANQHSLDLVQKGPAVVFNGKKMLGPRIFNVKILEYGENVKILVSDKSDTYRLLLKSSDIFPEFAWKDDWVEVVNSIMMENDRLILSIKPYDE